MPKIKEHQLKRKLLDEFKDFEDVDGEIEYKYCHKKVRKQQIFNGFSINILMLRGEQEIDMMAYHLVIQYDVESVNNEKE